MCYRPLSISNPKQNKDRFLDKEYLTVPCGHCVDCLDDKRLSWFVRLYYQWLDTNLAGGYTYYLTLTYNENTVPRLGDFRVFRQKDISNYIRAIRMRIRRMFQKSGKEYECKFKVFYSGEYAPSNKYFNTHRPHYHILFFVKEPLSRNTFKSIVDGIWKNEYGFVRCGTRNGGFVDSVGALHYCAKYVCKDIAQDNWCRHIRLAMYGNAHDKYVREDLKNKGLSINPLHRASDFLGMCALGLEPYENIRDGFCVLPDKYLGKKKYHLPLQLDRWAHYNVTYNDKGNPVYVLNENGLDAKIARKKKFEESFKKEFVALMQQNGEHIDISILNQRLHTSFKNFEQICSFINKKTTLSELTQYAVAYHGYHREPTLLLRTPHKSLCDSHYNMHYHDNENVHDSFDEVNEYFHYNDAPLCYSLVTEYTRIINLPTERKKEKSQLESEDRRKTYLFNSTYD